MKRIVLLLIASAAASCGQAGKEQAAAEPAAAKPKPAYCFFKDPDTKGWKARRDAAGNVVVTGRAYRQDPRYMAAIGKVDVTGTAASVWPTVKLNDTGYASPGNWWTVTQTIPNSAGVTSVAVRCGAKTFAELSVPAKT